MTRFWRRGRAPSRRKRLQRRGAELAAAMDQWADVLASHDIGPGDSDLIRNPPSDWSDDDYSAALDSVEDLVSQLNSNSMLHIEGPGGTLSEMVLDSRGTLVRESHSPSEEPPSDRFFAGPFTAPPVSGPASPPLALLRAVPLLGDTLSQPDPGIPAVRDWSWRAGESKSPGGRMSHWPDWEAQDEAALEAAWVDPAWDAYVRETINAWAWAWPDVVGDEAAARIPDAISMAVAAHDSDPRFARKRDAHRAAWADAAFHLGVHEMYRCQMSWPDPEAQNCAVCGRSFAPETLSHWMRRFGPYRYCPACCVRAINGYDGDCDREFVIAAVQALAQSLSFIPTSNRTPMCQLAGVADESARDRAMAALMTTPPSSRCADVLGLPTGRGRWLGVLKAADLVTDGRKTPRGTMCTAADGHFCRSLGERSVDDWLSNHGVEHETEPSWPEHPELNTAGLKRADWVLPGGVFVEYAGMLDDENYAAKMNEKVKLARQSGIELLVLTPTDLPRLDSVLGGWSGLIPPG